MAGGTRVEMGILLGVVDTFDTLTLESVVLFGLAVKLLICVS